MWILPREMDLNHIIITRIRRWIRKLEFKPIIESLGHLKTQGSRER
jgi:hypothetical protein